MRARYTEWGIGARAYRAADIATQLAYDGTTLSEDS
jgi:hypothetical protein